MEGLGYPTAFVVAPGSVPDREMLRETLAGSIKSATAPEGAKPTLICDRGYSGGPAQAVIEAAGFEYRAPPMEDDDLFGLPDRPLTKEEREIRARVERTHS